MLKIILNLFKEKLVTNLDSFNIGAGGRAITHYNQHNKPKTFFGKGAGFSIIELVVSLAILGIIVVSISSVLASTHRLYSTSRLMQQAMAYAKESLELVIQIQNNALACSCGASCTTCTASDGQTCNPSPGYTSCWTDKPRNLSTFTAYYLEPISGVWQLQGLATGAKETIVADPIFSREITIENIANNFNRKKVTVTVYWLERGETKQQSLSTILTAWKNI